LVSREGELLHGSAVLSLPLCKGLYCYGRGLLIRTVIFTLERKIQEGGMGIKTEISPDPHIQHSIHH
jgi:hypothetical protein